MSYLKTFICMMVATTLTACASTKVNNDERSSEVINKKDISSELVITDAQNIKIEPEGGGVTGAGSENANINDLDTSAGLNDASESTSSEALPENTHVISLLVKTPNHPFYGVGDKTGFSLDGVEGNELVLERGKTYTFVIRSTPMHDVYISADEMGWGAKVVEEGIEGNFTYEGELKITPNDKTPDVIFYQCQNHKAMGARLFIVDQGDTRTVEQLIVEYGALNESAVGQVTSQISDAEVKQKLSYANLVFMSKPAKRVLASDDLKAKELLSASQQKLQDARALHTKGDNVEAMALIDTALRNMSLASQMVPSEGLINEQKHRYNEALKHLAQQQQSHEEAVTRMSSLGEETVVYDDAAVARYKQVALDSVKKDDYSKALSSIQEADKLVTLAINEMLDSQTVKYELNLDTPKGEYDYEYDRYLGYAELIPIAIEEKKPSSGQLTLLDGFVKKGEAMRVKAEEKAAEENYPDGIRLMQEATKQVRRALRMLGIKQ